MKKLIEFNTYQQIRKDPRNLHDKNELINRKKSKRLRQVKTSPRSESFQQKYPVLERRDNSPPSIPYNQKNNQEFSDYLFVGTENKKPDNKIKYKPYHNFGNNNSIDVSIPELHILFENEMEKNINNQRNSLPKHKPNNTRMRNNTKSRDESKNRKKDEPLDL